MGFNIDPRAMTGALSKFGGAVGAQPAGMSNFDKYSGMAGGGYASSPSGPGSMVQQGGGGGVNMGQLAGGIAGAVATGVGNGGPRNAGSNPYLKRVYDQQEAQRKKGQAIVGMVLNFFTGGLGGTAMNAAKSKQGG